MFARHPLLARVVLMTVAMLLVAASSSAQYFGANKVQYKAFTFEVLKTEHFDIYFYAGERDAARMVARMAERWHARLRQVLDHELRGRQPIVLYASHPDFEQTTVIDGDIGEGTGGVTEPLRRRIVIPMAGPIGDTDHVLGHELVHAFQFDITRGDTAADVQLARLPLWFVEGMAEYLSVGPVDPQTALWLRDAVHHDDIPDLDHLDRSKYFPYRWGHAFWAYVAGRWGDAAIVSMLRTGAASDAETAVHSVTGLDTKTFSSEWAAAIREQYAPVLARAAAPDTLGRALAGGSGLGHEVNVGPALSPDGRWVAFLAQRSVFAMDLFVADAHTGRIVRRLTSSASSPHYSSLQFIASAGAWDRTSTRLVVATVTAGRAALTIFNGMTGARLEDIVLTGVDEAFSPTWAPDGRQVAFSGMAGGTTDLFVYDLDARQLRRLTRDAYADIQPAWSPDGRAIAFSTDRFTTELPRLHAGPYRLALIDPATMTIRLVAAAQDGSSLSPQWVDQGASLLFVSNRDGTPNIYRVSLADARVWRLTDVATGIAGITATSPALSVRADGQVAAINVFDDRRYEIRLLDLAGRDTSGGPAALAQLPSGTHRDNEVAALLADASHGLPPPIVAPDVQAYSPRLQLDGIATTAIGVGFDRFGTTAAGALGFSFSDMLNTHRVFAAVQYSASLSGEFSAKDIGAEAAYLNQTRRWTWGGLGGQIPYVTGSYTIDSGFYNGEPADREEIRLYRQTERAGSALVAYPFDRFRRVELQGGVTSIAFDRLTRTSIYSQATGNLLYTGSDSAAVAGTMTMATTAAAFVVDRSNFGATSPVQGERYRLEVAPAFGTIHTTSLLADYRRYLMPVSFYTVALRGLHYGRYGSGAEDPRLAPLFVGYPSLVRGYDVNSFSMAECVPAFGSTCPVVDRLLGSRMLVGNAELRMPLLRPFGATTSMYGPVPVEVALFADAGVAWNRGERPTLLGGHRDGITSAGVTVRVNMMGMAIAQLDFARPFQRPGAGWEFQFSLLPGF